MKNAKATVKTSSNSNPSTKYSVPSSPGEVFPGNSYIPVVGVHVTLLTFNALFLPRTTFLQELTNIPIDLAQLSSLDRPQHPFLDPLTLSPLTTTLYICFGAAILQSWWAGYIREWWSLILVDGSENEQLEKVLLDRQKIKVRVYEIRQYQPWHPYDSGIHNGMDHNIRCFSHISLYLDLVRGTLLLVCICLSFTVRIWWDFRR